MIKNDEEATCDLVYAKHSRQWLIIGKGKHRIWLLVLTIYG